MSTSRSTRSCTQTTQPEHRSDLELLAAATRFARLSAAAPTTADGWPGHIEAAAEALVHLARVDLEHAARVYAADNAAASGDAGGAAFWEVIDEMIAAHTCDYGADGNAAGALLEHLAAGLAHAMAVSPGVHMGDTSDAARTWLATHGDGPLPASSEGRRRTHNPRLIRP